MTRAEEHSRYRFVRCIRQELVNAQSCYLSNAPQQARRGGMNVALQVCNRRLAHSETPCKFGLGDSLSFAILNQGFHSEMDNISLPYRLAIGRSYRQFGQNLAMPKTRERSFLDRAMEALRDRYPKDRPTQTRLAKIAGVSQPAVHEWGMPGRAPEHARVLKLALELNVCVEWLYTGRGPKHPPAQPDEPFLACWQNLDPDTRKQIALYTEFLKGSSPPRQ